MPWNPLNEEGRIALIVSGQAHEECSVTFTQRGRWQHITCQVRRRLVPLS